MLFFENFIETEWDILFVMRLRHALWNDKTRVTSYVFEMIKHELRVTCCKLRVTSYELKAKKHELKFKSTSSNPRVQIYKLRIQLY